jgi:hypothetical protein
MRTGEEGEASIFCISAMVWGGIGDKERPEPPASWSPSQPASIAASEAAKARAGNLDPQKLFVIVSLLSAPA